MTEWYKLPNGQELHQIWDPEDAITYFACSAQAHIQRAGKKPGESYYDAILNARKCLDKCLEVLRQDEGEFFDEAENEWILKDEYGRSGVLRDQSPDLNDPEERDDTYKIKEWASQRLISCPNSFTPVGGAIGYIASELYPNYCNYCHQIDVEPIDLGRFRDLLEDALRDVMSLLDNITIWPYYAGSKDVVDTNDLVGIEGVVIQDHDKYDDEKDGHPSADISLIIDWVVDWADKSLIYSPGEFTPLGSTFSDWSNELYANYYKYCCDVNTDPVSLQLFSELLQPVLLNRLGYHHYNVYKDESRRTNPGFWGIAIRDDSNEQSEDNKENEVSQQDQSAIKCWINGNLICSNGLGVASTFSMIGDSNGDPAKELYPNYCKYCNCWNLQPLDKDFFISQLRAMLEDHDAAIADTDSGTEIIGFWGVILDDNERTDNLHLRDRKIS